ncbi:MAG: hypothetical protein N2109_01865 [Fimbriimonadales bacterium]|nr:hypothetical protein [Fimbriimonadales bacterium]
MTVWTALAFWIALGPSEPVEVVRVETARAFAGRLGDRVEQTLVLRDGLGRERTVRLGRTHTRVAGRLPSFRPGDRLWLPTGRFALLDSVRR